MLALEIVFWLCVALIVWTQIGYALALAALARVGGRARDTPAPLAAGQEPALSLVIAAHDEEAVIDAKVRNALALDYPRERLEVIVACDGCTDATAERARAAGADLVLELPRGGKIRAQDAAVERARGELVAFSDANALWEPGAARTLVAAFADPRVGYACGQVRFVQAVPTRAPATTRRGSTGATRWRCASSSRACPRSPRATARSTRRAARATSSSTP